MAVESCTQTQFLLLFIALQVSSSFQNPVLFASTEKSHLGCEYYEWEKEISCKQMELVSVPIFSGPVKILDVSNNQIRQLTNEALVKLPFLEYLDLSHNRLSEIKNGVFGNYPGESQKSLIKHLDLSENGVLKIENNAFKKLPFLSELYLNDNLLTEITKGVLIHLLSLEILWLSKNNLTHLSPNVFEGNSNLLSLFLDRNKFVILPDSIFRCCLHLEVINLSGNQLQYVPDSVKDLPNLRYLYLSNNRLIDITPVTFHLWALEALTLENNPLQCSCNLNQVQQWMIRKGALNTKGDICYRRDGNTPVKLSTLSKTCQEWSEVNNERFRKVGGKFEYTIIVREDLVNLNSFLLVCLTILFTAWFILYLLSFKVSRRLRRRMKGNIELM